QKWSTATAAGPRPVTCANTPTARSPGRCGRMTNCRRRGWWS
ncbi:MAG: hypothetical protein AVDCRST_MAG90-2355, partial [uncultured Microvirga sp.]